MLNNKSRLVAPNEEEKKTTDEIMPVFDKNALREIGKRSGKHLKRMREKAGFTQNQITNDEENKKSGFPSLTTYKDMERGHIETSFETFIQMFHRFEGTDRDAAVLFGNRESDPYVNYSHDDSPGHIARLNKFVRQKYCIYFVDEMDVPKEMKIQFTNIVNSSYVQGTAKIGRKYAYDCKLLSPVNSDYVFIYFTSTTSLVDRALFIMPEIPWVISRVKKAIGMMLSISTDGQNCPTTQLYALVHDIYEKPDLEMLKQHLILNGASTSEYMMRIPDLMDRNKHFAKNMLFVRKQKQKEEVGG